MHTLFPVLSPRPRRTTGPFVVVGLAWLAAVGCASPGQPGEPGEPDTAHEPDGPAAMGDGDSRAPQEAWESGQTGSLGPVQCEMDSECEAIAAAAVEPLTRAASGPGTVTGASCRHVSIADPPVSGAGCECAFSDSGARWLGPVGLGCHLDGRGGTCLADDADVTGCDEDDPATCEASCELLRARLQADAEHRFEVRVLHASCSSEGGCRRVVEIDGQCYANGSERFGEGYDCALGVEGVLAAYVQAHRPLEETADLIPDRSPYQPGVDGFIELAVSQPFWGTHAGEAGFGAFAQFFWVEGEPGGQFGEILDPLDGADDCMVARGGGLGSAPNMGFLSVASLSLIDEGREIPVEESRASNPQLDFYSYGVGLSDLGVRPRFGGAYGLRGGGGGFETTFDIDGIVLPAALSSSLDRQARIDPEDFTLQWTGRGDAPLVVRFYFSAQPDFAWSSGEIYCELTDDGEHRFPPELFQDAPGQFARVTLARRAVRSHAVGDKTIKSIGSVSADHTLALGPACDGREAMMACEQASAQILDAYAECGQGPAPSRQELCPDYLLEACGTCPAQFTCRAKQYRCGPTGLTVESRTCGCPQ